MTPNWATPPSYKLFDAIHVERKPEVTVPRSYRDYTVRIDPAPPAGVTCERLT